MMHEERTGKPIAPSTVVCGHVLLWIGLVAFVVIVTDAIIRNPCSMKNHERYEIVNRSERPLSIRAAVLDEAKGDPGSCRLVPVFPIEPRRSQRSTLAPMRVAARSSATFLSFPHSGLVVLAQTEALQPWQVFDFERGKAEIPESLVGRTLATDDFVVSLFDVNDLGEVYTWLLPLGFVTWCFGFLSLFVLRSLGSRSFKEDGVAGHASRIGRLTWIAAAFVLCLMPVYFVVLFRLRAMPEL